MSPASAGTGPVVDPKRLREACRVALAVALEGELADPAIAAPTALVPILRFTRLSAKAYIAIVRVVDDDDGFRARVAASAAAEESAIGRAGWLWLNRPDGWASDPAIGTRPARSEPSTPSRRDEARRRREQADAEARRKTKDQLGAARKEAASAQREVTKLRERLDVLQSERNEAVRGAKQLEADLAAARRDLRVARKAAIDAEQELASIKRGEPSAEPLAAADPSAVDVERLAEVVRAAAAVAADLERQLAEAVAIVGPVPAVDPTPPKPPKGGKGKAGKAGKSAKAGKGSSARARGTATVRVRPLPMLPPGLFDGSPEADRHLVRSGEAQVFVDGYNLARTTWSGLQPEEERRRIVRMLEGVAARSGAATIVVFDGESGTVAPRASRHIRVMFSPSGVTADEEIARLLGSLPRTSPALVVSSDRAVVADARRQGAATMSSQAFAAAAR